MDVVELVTEPKLRLVGDGTNCPRATPFPETEIDADVVVFLPPFFPLLDAVIDTDPLKVPAVVGAKLMENASVCPGDKDEDVEIPDTLNPKGTAILVIEIIALPLLVTLADCVLVLATTTLPKLIEEGATEICAAVLGDVGRDPVHPCTNTAAMATNAI